MSFEERFSDLNNYTLLVQFLAGSIIVAYYLLIKSNPDFFKNDYWKKQLKDCFNQYAQWDDNSKISNCPPDWKVSWKESTRKHEIYYTVLLAIHSIIVLLYSAYCEVCNHETLVCANCETCRIDSYVQPTTGLSISTFLMFGFTVVHIICCIREHKDWHKFIFYGAIVLLAISAVFLCFDVSINFLENHRYIVHFCSLLVYPFALIPLFRRLRTNKYSIEAKLNKLRKELNQNTKTPRNDIRNRMSKEETETAKKYIEIFNRESKNNRREQLEYLLETEKPIDMNICKNVIEGYYDSQKYEVHEHRDHEGNMRNMINRAKLSRKEKRILLGYLSNNKNIDVSWDITNQLSRLSKLGLPVQAIYNEYKNEHKQG